MKTHSTSLLAALALSLALSSVTFADPPADKGKGANKDSGASAYPYDDGKKDKYKDDDRYDDRYGDDKDNHGQVVSECNHRANDRKLKGQDRKEYVDWCVDRGARYKYDDKRWNEERSCYREISIKDLDPERRRQRAEECIQKQSSGTRKK